MKLATYRKSARLILDFLRFGNGVPERLCAAVLYSAFFFGVTFAIFIGTGFAIGTSITASIAGMLFAFAVFAFFVFGESDVAIEESLTKLKLLEYQLKTKETQLAIAQNQANRNIARSAGNRITRPNSAQPVSRKDGSIVTYSYRAEDVPNSKMCPYCMEEVHYDARKCKHCGEIIDRNLQRRRDEKEISRLDSLKPKWSPGAAIFLSWFFPGGGQFYKGEAGKGICFLFLIPVGYFACILPGILLQIISIFDAASGDPYDREFI